MALTQRLDLRQTQALVMTPQLQQAIKLLQLSNFELSAFVEAELEQNPLLERVEAAAEPPPIEGVAAAPAAETAPEPLKGDAETQWPEEAASEPETGAEGSGDLEGWQLRSGRIEGDDASGPEQLPARPENL